MYTCIPYFSTKTNNRIMRYTTFVTFLACFSFGFNGVKCASTREDLENIYDQSLNVITEYQKFIQISTEQYGEIKIETVISSIFERYTMFLIQVHLLACIAFYNLGGAEDTTGITDLCFIFSQSLISHRNNFSVRRIYDKYEKPVKINHDAIFKIENVIEDIEKMFVKLTEMESAFEFARQQGYQSLFPALSLNNNFSPDQMEIKDGFPDTRMLLLQRFFNYFEPELQKVENYWNGFFNRKKNELIRNSETIDRRFRLPNIVTSKNSIEFNKLDSNSILTLILLEVNYYGRLIEENYNQNVHIKNKWRVVVPDSGPMDFQYQSIPILHSWRDYDGSASTSGGYTT